MHKDHHELVCRLFVIATEILEDTHIVAALGQSSRLDTKSYRSRAQRLVEAARELSNVAGAITAVTRLPRTAPPLK